MTDDDIAELERRHQLEHLQTRELELMEDRNSALDLCAKLRVERDAAVTALDEALKNVELETEAYALREQVDRLAADNARLRAACEAALRDDATWRQQIIVALDHEALAQHRAALDREAPQ